MKHKITIELEQEAYDKLQDIYKDTIKAMPQEKAISFEQFITELLNPPVNLDKNANGKFSFNDIYNETFKNIFKNIDQNQLDEILSSFKNLGEVFGMPTETKKETKTKSDDKTDIDAMKKKS